MDKKNNNRYVDIEDGTSDDLLDFLKNSNTYFVEDEKTGVVGDKKTGIMIDKRTGKIFSDQKAKDMKYDFLDYKECLSILNSSDSIKDPISKEFPKEDYFNEENTILKEENSFSEDFDNKENTNEKVLNKVKVSRKDITLKKYLDDKFKNKEVKNITQDLSALEDSNINAFENNEESLIDISKQSDEEILDKINEKFNSIENQFASSKNNSDIGINGYSFSSFEEYEEKTKEISKKQEFVEENNLEAEIESKKENEFDNFRMIIDFEDYLSDMADEETILKSPFEETDEYHVPEVKVEEKVGDDLFLPFDSINDFEVEEIQTYDLENENALEEGMFPEFELNKSMSKKVSIREVIKSKQKKKQEQKELQEKLFFETIDEKIEQFKKFKEHSIDSQEILNAINVDLNRINSSIKVEFESLRNKRNTKKKNVKAEANKDNKFSLQNLLEEISDDKKETAPEIVKENDLDLESIKKDLVKEEKENKIVN